MHGSVGAAGVRFPPATRHSDEDDLFHDTAPFLESLGNGEVGIATSSWAVPS
jgi:hypothetical protein